MVTGSASGIGRAVALAFAAQRMTVVLVDRDSKGLEHLATEVEAQGSTAAIAGVELADEASIKNMLAKLALSRVDVLVNNAGIDLAKPLTETTEEDLDRLMAVNLKVPFLLCKAVVPLMPGDGSASIVNVSSAAGLLPMGGRPAYNASKGALVSLTRSLAIDLAPAIRVNCVCPGAVDTPLLRSSFPKQASLDESLRAVMERYPLRRMGEANEIAQAVLFLASTTSGYITGVSLAVDGGRSLH